MSNPSVARQMDPPDSKQSSGSHELLHLPWIYCRTQTTLPSLPTWPAGRTYHDRFWALNLNQLCRPALQDLLLEEKDFGHVLAILSTVPETVTYMDFKHIGIIAVFLYRFNILTSCSWQPLCLWAGRSPAGQLVLQTKSGHCFHFIPTNSIVGN